jgi:hypothetical protein
VLCLAGAVLAGCGSGSPQADQTRRLDAIRRATRLFASPDAALARGYLQVPGCIQSSDGSGALGTLFVSRSAPKNRVDLDHPQELFYDLNPAHGSRPFLGVGYVVDNTGQRPPSTQLGHMDGPLPGVLPGQPSHFELHAWLFRPSPDGVLSFWNRNVSC